MSSQFKLMGERRFLPFFLTQFLGAFNDNFYKNALVVLMTFQAGRFTTLPPGVLVNLAAGLFILPFFLFSATARQIADKYEKSRLIRFTKLLEIAIMVLGALAFAVEYLGLMLFSLFLMGTQSAIFGPVKYAILPQHLREEELVGGRAPAGIVDAARCLVARVEAAAQRGRGARKRAWSDRTSCCLNRARRRKVTAVILFLSGPSAGMRRARRKRQANANLIRNERTSPHDARSCARPPQHHKVSGGHSTSPLFFEPRHFARICRDFWLHIATRTTSFARPVCFLRHTRIALSPSRPSAFAHHCSN